jgi:hypothetical protein
VTKISQFSSLCFEMPVMLGRDGHLLASLNLPDRLHLEYQRIPYPLHPLFCTTHFNLRKPTLTISSSGLFGCDWVGVIECIFGKLTYLLGTLIRFEKSACASSKFWPSLRCRCGVFDTSTNFRVFTCIFV